MKLLWLSVGFAASGCIAPYHVETRPLTPGVLNSDSNAYDGKIVEVEGLLILQPEAHVLYESKRKYREMQAVFDQGGDVDLYDQYCLTIANPDFFYDRSKSFQQRVVRLKGVFLKQYIDRATEIDLGACVLDTGFFVHELKESD
jgi:hypothetical protein